MPTVQVSLALQGGGAHGAFTWGVLDRLLQIPGIQIDAISGTSSGAMNACALAQGWARRGADGAREELASFWLSLARWNAVPGWWVATARALYQGGAWAGKEQGSMRYNPLRDFTGDFFDMAALRRGPVRLFLAATRVRDGQLEIFGQRHLSLDTLLASACLPLMSPAVEIGGEAYWDGGFAGNPVLEPLLRTTDSGDIMMVLLQPFERGPPPGRARDIAERAAQISFNAAFSRELRGLAHTRQRLHGRMWLTAEERRLKSLRLHLITPPGELVRRFGNSALDTRLLHLRALHQRGRDAADAWCNIHQREVGRRSTFALESWNDAAA